MDDDPTAGLLSKEDKLNSLTLHDKQVRRLHHNLRRFTPAELDKLKPRITQMRMRGYSFQEIANDTGLSVGYAYKLYKNVEALWIKESLEAIQRQKARELARLEMVERTAWEAWERSQRMAVKTQQDLIATSDGKAKPSKGRRVEEEQVGNPKWLDVVLKCVEMRARLLGLYDPDQVRVITKDKADDVDARGNSLEARIAQYRTVFPNALVGVAVVGLAGTTHGDDRPGESVDSQRSAPEASPVLDVDGSYRDDST